MPNAANHYVTPPTSAFAGRANPFSRGRPTNCTYFMAYQTSPLLFIVNSLLATLTS